MSDTNSHTNSVQYVRGVAIKLLDYHSIDKAHADKGIKSAYFLIYTLHQYTSLITVGGTPRNFQWEGCNK